MGSKRRDELVPAGSPCIRPAPVQAEGGGVVRAVWSGGEEKKANQSHRNGFEGERGSSGTRHTITLGNNCETLSRH